MIGNLYLLVDHGDPEAGGVAADGGAEEGHLDRRQQEDEHQVTAK